MQASVAGIYRKGQPGTASGLNHQHKSSLAITLGQNEAALESMGT